MKKEFRITTFVLLLFLASCSSQSTTSESSETSNNDVNKPLVERISLESLDGTPIDLNELKGKVVFINFWATWCKPCIKEMPSIDKARKLMVDEPVVFLVASDEDVNRIRKFTSRQDFTFQFAHSKSSVFDLDLRALPTTMIINPEGQIVYNEMGGRDWATDENLKFIKSFKK